MLHVYTGNGKGKTTAALGLAIRALGWRKKVLIVQLLKGRETGESVLFEYLESQGFPVRYIQIGPKRFINLKSPPKDVVETISKGLDKVLKVINIFKPELIILDELNVVLAYNIIPLEKAFKLIEAAEKVGAEIVFTGRKAPKEIVNLADLVTEMKKVKHYFDKGVVAKKGIEY